MITRRDFLKLTGTSIPSALFFSAHHGRVRRVGLPTLEDFYDMSIDILELEEGEYHPPRLNISIDRSLRPLLIRPVEGARVIWNGDQTEGTGCLYFGWSPRTPAASFVFDGRNGDSSWSFVNFRVGRTGIVYMAGSHHLKFLHLDFAGNIGLAPVNSNSHTFYIASDSARGRSHDIEIAYCRIDGGGRTLTGSHIFHDPLPKNVFFHNNLIQNCANGCIWWGEMPDNIPQVNIQAYNNVFVDCDSAINTNYTTGVASGNWSLRAPSNIRPPFVNEETNVWLS